MASNWYTSKQWQHKRENILRRDGYICRYASRYGRREPAEIVHHIFPREEYPQYALCSWNLISLSRASHNVMHDRDTRELTAEGVDLLRRTARKNNISIPEKYSELSDNSASPPVIG